MEIGGLDRDPYGLRNISDYQLRDLLFEASRRAYDIQTILDSLSQQIGRKQLKRRDLNLNQLDHIMVSHLINRKLDNEVQLMDLNERISAYRLELNRRLAPAQLTRRPSRLPDFRSALQ